MKFLVLLMAVLMCTVNAKEEVVQEIVDIVEGLLEGIFDGTFPVKECIEDSHIMIDDVEAAATALKKVMDVAHVAEALINIGKVVKLMPTAVENCKNCAGIIKKIEGLVTLFDDPVKTLEKIGINIVWHHKDVTRSIKGAIKA